MTSKNKTQQENDAQKEHSDEEVIDQGINDNNDSEPDGQSNQEIEDLDAEQLNQYYLEKIDGLRKELDQAKKAQSQANDKMLRAAAEMENVKRRAEKDVSSAHKFALEKFAKDLLPVLDSLEKACEVQSDQAEVLSMREGVEMTLKMFLEVAEKYNLKQINPIGETFNPELHEAISMQNNPELDSNTVMAVVQKGYLLNDRVVRAARVVVAS